MTTSSIAPPPRRRIVAAAWTKNPPARTEETPASSAATVERRRRREAPRRTRRALPGGDELFITHPDVLLVMLGEDAGFEVPDAASDATERRVEARRTITAHDDERSFDEEASGDEPADQDLAEEQLDFAGPTPPDIAALCTEHIEFADAIARDVYERIGDRVPIDIVLSAGRYGLWDAARRFDVSRRVYFRSYAKRRIIGAIVDDLRRERVIAARKTRSPALSALLGACGLPTSELTDEEDVGWLLAWRATLGLRAMPVACGVSLAGVTATEDMPADDQLAREELSSSIRSAVRALSPRDQAFINGIYERERTLEDVAASMNLSKSWGSRIHAEIIVGLKRAMLRAGYREHFASIALPSLVD